MSNTCHAPLFFNQFSYPVTHWDKRTENSHSSVSGVLIFFGVAADTSVTHADIFNNFVQSIKIIERYHENYDMK